jgi:hypothetical protein
MHQVGDKVIHIDYPSKVGVVVAKTKRWGAGIPFFLVNWEKSKHCSRHISSALKKVG